MTRWQVDDQPPDLALAHRSQLGCDHFEMPVCRERSLRIKLAKTALSEKPEIRPKDRVVFRSREVFHRWLTRSRFAGAPGCVE